MRQLQCKVDLLSPPDLQEPAKGFCEFRSTASRLLRTSGMSSRRDGLLNGGLCRKCRMRLDAMNVARINENQAGLNHRPI